MAESTIDFSTYTPVNHLWPAFVERLGSEKAQQAVRQALGSSRHEWECRQSSRSVC